MIPLLLCLRRRWQNECHDAYTPAGATGHDKHAADVSAFLAKAPSSLQPQISFGTERHEENSMSGISPTIRSFNGQRGQYQTTRSFDEVLSSLRQHVGHTTVSEVNQQAGGGSREEFEKRVEAFAGDSEFMLFLEVRHTEWLKIFGVNRKVIRWVFGNPIIAYTMIRHDITAGLFAPVELLLYESESGIGSTILYDLPSSLMILDENTPLLVAAKALDQKLADLIAKIT
jgi:uncharacterized protein (DUF302 family)